jgi:hypothetical protein
MDLVDHFFSHAAELAARGEHSDTEQIDFRRAVSAAYYAVFHLLTMTAAESWAVGRERHRFARLFEHGKIRAASLALPGKLKERLGGNTSPDDQKTADTLGAVAKEFVTLQQDRNGADYDNSRYCHTRKLKTSSNGRTNFTYAGTLSPRLRSRNPTSSTCLEESDLA